MKVRTFTWAASVMAVTIAILTAPCKLQAQMFPANDAFDVTLLHTVTVAGKTLQPGTYRMEPLNVAGGDAPVLVIRDGDGARKEISAAIVPIYAPRPQTDTRVFFRHVGHKYYFDTIWVKGQYYGYKFPLPKDAKPRGGDQ